MLFNRPKENFDLIKSDADAKKAEADFDLKKCKEEATKAIAEIDIFLNMSEQKSWELFQSLDNNYRTGKLLLDKAFEEKRYLEDSIGDSFHRNFWVFLQVSQLTKRQVLMEYPSPDSMFRNYGYDQTKYFMIEDELFYQAEHYPEYIKHIIETQKKSYKDKDTLLEKCISHKYADIESHYSISLEMSSLKKRIDEYFQKKSVKDILGPDVDFGKISTALDKLIEIVHKCEQQIIFSCKKSIDKRENERNNNPASKVKIG